MKKEFSLTLFVFLSTIGAVAVMSPASTSDSMPVAETTSGIAQATAGTHSVRAVAHSFVLPVSMSDVRSTVISTFGQNYSFGRNRLSVIQGSDIPTLHSGYGR